MMSTVDWSRAPERPGPASRCDILLLLPAVATSRKWQTDRKKITPKQIIHARVFCRMFRLGFPTADKDSTRTHAVRDQTSFRLRTYLTSCLNTPRFRLSPYKFHVLYILYSCIPSIKYSLKLTFLTILTICLI